MKCHHFQSLQVQLSSPCSSLLLCIFDLVLLCLLPLIQVSLQCLFVLLQLSDSPLQLQQDCHVNRVLVWRVLVWRGLVWRGLVWHVLNNNTRKHLF